MSALIFAWLMAQQPTKYDADEPPEDRAARMSVIAEAVSAVAGSDKGLAAFLLVDARHESHFDRAVQMCECRPGTCDWDKRTKTFRARGLLQIHRAPQFPNVWESVCGTSLEAQTMAFRWVARYYLVTSLECSYAALGGRNVSCGAAWARERAGEARWLQSKL
jgi:hypothetical protein